MVADEVRSLAARTSSATEEVGRMVADIRQQSEAVVSYIQRQANELDAAAEQIATTGEQLSGIAGLAGSVESQVEQITTGTADNHQRLTGQFVALDQLRADALDSEKQTRQLEQAAERLVAQAESASEQLAEVQLDDYHQAMFDLARQGAAAIAERFEADIQAGRVSLDDLFDRNYRALPNTDPVKYQTRFDKYADEVLPAIQEPLLQRHPALVYAIATTPEGYVPTHNRAFSQPPVGNPEIDRVKSRSKRLFNDRTGGRCGSHQRRLLLQTYSRDTGELMHDLSVPIMVRGRHWVGCGRAIAPSNKADPEVGAITLALQLHGPGATKLAGYWFCGDAADEDAHRSPRAIRGLPPRPAQPAHPFRWHSLIVVARPCCCRAPASPGRACGSVRRRWCRLSPRCSICVWTCATAC